MLHITAITLFPDLFPGPLGASLTGRALKEGKWSMDTINIRDFGIGPHNQVDDTPYGGGAGMVLRADVVAQAIDAAIEKAGNNYTLIHLTPRGKAITQPVIHELATKQKTSPNQGHHLIFLCGRFEAIDERILDHYQPLELSLGDFVMTGGELAAMAIIDATVRLLPEVIGDADSLGEESFGLSQDYACLLEYPHYSKPPIWRGKAVPEVLTSGHHEKVNQWRKAQAEKITQERRPDVWQRYLKR